MEFLSQALKQTLDLSVISIAIGTSLALFTASRARRGVRRAGKLIRR
jgi:hypothetical protein